MIDYTIDYTKLPKLQRKLLETAKELMGEKYYEATLRYNLIMRVYIDDIPEVDDSMHIVFYLRTDMYDKDDDNNTISVDVPLKAVNYFLE